MMPGEPTELPERALRWSFDGSRARTHKQGGWAKFRDYEILWVAAHRLRSMVMKQVCDHAEPVSLPFGDGVLTPLGLSGATSVCACCGNPIEAANGVWVHAGEVRASPHPARPIPIGVTPETAAEEVALYARANDLLDRACEEPDGYGRALDELVRLYRIERDGRAITR